MGLSEFQDKGKRGALAEGLRKTCSKTGVSGAAGSRSERLSACPLALPQGSREVPAALTRQAQYPGLLAAGVYTVQVHGVADTGAAGPVSQLEVVVDTTPPVLRCTALYV